MEATIGAVVERGRSSGEFGLLAVLGRSLAAGVEALAFGHVDVEQGGCSQEKVRMGGLAVRLYNTD
jgi:hypothetical protein